MTKSAKPKAKASRPPKKGSTVKQPSPLVVGLTGGIGMGKSTAAKILNGMGFPVYHADQAVHALMQKKGRAVKQVAALFPAAFRDGAIDRAILGPMAFASPAKLKKLEAILHPMVRKTETEFLAKAKSNGAPAAVLEIPLLLETGGEKRCDFVLCVSAPKAIQKARVMAREGMNSAKFKAIVKRQMSDKMKRDRSDFVIDTSTSVKATGRQLKAVMKKILKS